MTEVISSMCNTHLCMEKVVKWAISLGLDSEEECLQHSKRIIEECQVKVRAEACCFQLLLVEKMTGLTHKEVSCRALVVIRESWETKGQVLRVDRHMKVTPCLCLARRGKRLKV